MKDARQTPVEALAAAIEEAAKEGHTPVWAGSVMEALHARGYTVALVPDDQP